MKAQTKITLAVSLGGLFAAGAYILHINGAFGSKPKIKLEEIDAKTQGQYDFVLETKIQEQNQTEREMLSFKGVLLLSEQGDHEFQSEWSSIESVKVNGQVVPPETLQMLVDVATLSKKESTGFVHYLSEEFPEAFASMQNSFLYKVFPNVDLKGASPQLAMESDEFGNVNVRYELTPSADTIAVNRLYVQSLNDSTRYDAKKNAVQYIYSSNGQLKSATGEVAVYLNAGSIITTRLSMQLKDTKLAQNKIQKLVAANMRLAPPRKPGAQLAPATTVEGLKSLDETFAQLDSLKGDALRSEYNDMLKNVVYDLYYNPGNLSKVVAKVKSISERDDDSKLKLTMLMAALAGTDSHAGAESLADLAKTGCEDDYCKQQAATGSIMHGNPSLKSASTLLEVAQVNSNEDVSTAAYLAAGSAGSKLGAEFVQLPGALNEALTQHPDGTMHRSVILAMGNHGDATYFNPLRDSLESKDSYDRGAAIFALRNLPNPEVNSLIKETFTKDADRSVVLDSVRAMYARNFEAADYLEIANASLKANQEVQEAAASMLLDQYIYNSRDASEAINSFKEKTKIPEVKTLINEGLARLEAAQRAEQDAINGTNSEPDEEEEQEQENKGQE